MQDRSSAQDVTCSAELDDENIFLDLIVILASIAMHAKFLMRVAGNIAAEMTAIGVNKKTFCRHELHTTRCRTPIASLITRSGRA